MSNDIQIKNGLTINLKGAPENIVKKASFPKSVSINPLNFHLITPKLVVKVGDKVKMGDVVFYSKKNPEIKFCSPVSGTVSDIVRGAKRKILEILIDSDNNQNIKKHIISKIDSYLRNDVLDLLLNSGCWPFIKQRPYDIIANPNDTPKSIFISAVSSAPIAADIEIILNDQKEEFKAGLNVLNKLTDGDLNVCIEKNHNSFIQEIDNISIHNVSGLHPAGNVGVQIHHIDPVNSGEKVWILGAEDVAIIGKLFLYIKVKC